MTVFEGVCINRKDKNGTLIFEGDYLRCNGHIYRVVWRDDILAYGIEDENGEWNFFDEYLSQDWEVICY